MRDDTPSNPLHTRIPAGAPIDSPHALQLERGFAGLRFDAPLEREFRTVFRAESLPQIRRNLWIALVIVVGFSLMTQLVLEPEVNRRMNEIRLVMFGPILFFGLMLVRSSLYQRYWPLTCQILAPVFGAGVAVLAVIAAGHGVNLISTVVIMTIFIYFMLGMLFHAALGSALLVTVAYVIAAVAAGLEAAAVIVDVGILVSANVIGAMVCYSLERANRTSYLEEQLLIETASRDGLTGIHNRRYFDDHMDRIWLQAIREQAPLALLLIDIDHFKAYNDHCGHQAGDECLRRVARSLKRTARRPLDVTARYGGEEFAIVLFDTRRDHVEELARRIQAGIESLAIDHPASPQGGRLTVSIGAACVQPMNGRSHFGFIQLADEALYAAKERGRNCVVVMDKEYEKLSTGSFRKSAGGGRVPI
ncbi:MAG TPA: GGDEF domain-containing protein [Povalibacter sp.]|uniref:GGDEF domain-containing protein n=1 Tax=Povalibacter sp. TaxID=1962978 RepID=UPI002BA1C0EC|nr:GGDEF domain-containing protein [Povalibacter sp.]HMN45451.1 GGDEF domain-containing protein [Povalibacter sp.]